MDIEFHYYLTKYLALEAGLEPDEAEIVAYSSQYVDDNAYRFNIQTPAGSTYANYISQTPDITQPEKVLMRIHILFHFLPGDPTSPKVRRRDGKMHLLITSPASTHAQEIFYDTTRSEDLYMLGIASHMLADTFAHQSFIGNLEEMNDMKGIWETLEPKIGHAAAGFMPDIPNLIWEDPRLIDKNKIINNKERLMLAARKLYNNFLIITSREEDWTPVKNRIEDIIGEMISENQLSLVKGQRQKRIQQYLKLLGNFTPQNEYNSRAWLTQTVKEKAVATAARITPSDSLTFTTDYENSNWFRFQEAIREYQQIATNKLEPIIAQLDIREW
ncbi:MAG: hypothetical protein JXB60_03595 [Candidatus Cloacimonetes bacterium]|nr:hypothetical protein [Candidatus Cloacimonadota bacterium]